MSKIFEALRKAEGELAEVAKAVLAEGTSPVPAAPDNVSASLGEPASDSPEIRADHNPTVRSVTIQLGPDSPMLAFDGSNGEAEEQYRIIRTKINHHPGEPRILLVSSTMAGDGKTISAINLALALSLQENRRVLLMDCDFRRSSASKLLGLAAGPGLGEVLRDEAGLEASLVRIKQFPNLYV